MNGKKVQESGRGEVDKINVGKENGQRKEGGKPDRDNMGEGLTTTSNHVPNKTNHLLQNMQHLM